MNWTQAQPTLAQTSAVWESTARYTNTRATCHAATATDTLNMAMLVREKRVTTIRIAKLITTAAVTAGGIAYGEKWYETISIDLRLLWAKRRKSTDFSVLFHEGTV